MKGFSTIELLVAFAISLSAIIATTLLSFGSEPLIKNLFLAEEAQARNYDALNAMRQLAATDFTLANVTATTSNETFVTVRSTHFIDDEDLIAFATASTSWHDVFGIREERADYAYLFDVRNAVDASPCNPMRTGNWERDLTIHSYGVAREDLLGSFAPSDSYALSSIAISGHSMAVGIGNTGLVNSPTLFFFTIPSNGSQPVVQPSAFDNAASSTVGFSTVAMHGDTVYAGNGFGSASASTCKTGSCDQVQIFSMKSATSTVKVSSLLLSTSSPPFALSSTGTTAPVKTLTYKDGYLYVGLQKTNAGSEFNVIDVHNSSKPLWKSGIAVGRTVNSIVVYRNRAYLSTDDPTRELMIIDVSDPTHPLLIGSYDLPGAIGFGFGRSIHVHDGVAQFGRSYVNNAPELYSIDVSDPSSPHTLASSDPGTVQNPRSIVSLLARGSYLYMLTDAAISMVSIASSTLFTPLRLDIPLAPHATGIALACSGNTLYAGMTSSSTPASFLETITTL